MHFVEYFAFLLFLRASVFAQSLSVTSSVAPNPLSVGSKIGVYNYVGCFADTPNENYILPNFVDGSGKNTVEWCIASCVNQTAPYAAVENQSQCFCGAVLNPYNSVTSESNCAKPCEANSTEKCGGNGYSNLYYNQALAAAQISVSVAFSKSSWSSKLAASRASVASSRSSASSVGSASRAASSASRASVSSVKSASMASASASRSSAQSVASARSSSHASSISAGRSSRSVSSVSRASSRSVASISAASRSSSRAASSASRASSRSAASATHTRVNAVPYRYYGCWPLDPANMPLNLHPRVYNNDLEVCANACFNHTNFGVAANQCYCGNSIYTSAVPTAPASCWSSALTCPGNTAELCGKSSWMPIYAQVTASGTCTPVSVWSTVNCSTITAHRSGATVGVAKRDPNGIEAFKEKQFLVEEMWAA